MFVEALNEEAEQAEKERQGQVYVPPQASAIDDDISGFDIGFTYQRGEGVEAPDEELG